MKSEAKWHNKKVVNLLQASSGKGVYLPKRSAKFYTASTNPLTHDI